MKKILIAFAMLLLLMCTACSSNEKAQQTAVQTIEMTPQKTQMRNICELATFDCYYHNVAKYHEKDAEGMLIWKKDRRFWIEYSGIVTIGIDVSKTDFSISEDTVTITLPSAEVQGCRVDPETLTDEAFIVDSTSAPVEASHQTAAFKDAQAKMEEAAKQDTALLENARQRARQLLEGYVNNVGDIVGKKYKIEWIYPEEDKAEPATEATS